MPNTSKPGKNRSILPNLESFFSSIRPYGSFNQFTSDLSEHFLSPFAKKWSKTVFWKHRHFTEQLLSLATQKKRKELIFRLIDKVLWKDQIYGSEFLCLENLSAIGLITKKVYRKADYAPHLYKDLLTKGSGAIYIHIENMLDTKEDYDLHMTCLDVLSAKMIPSGKKMLKDGKGRPS